jgi:hypothetical protein
MSRTDFLSSLGACPSNDRRREDDRYSDGLLDVPVRIVAKRLQNDVDFVARHIQMRH